MSSSPPDQALDDVISAARSRAARPVTDEQWDELWEQLDRLAPFGREAFDAAIRLLAGPCQDRALGCHLLGALCNPDQQGWSHEAAVALAGVAEDEPDAEVLWAVCNALHMAGDPIGVPVLTGLRHHPDPGIRTQVAIGLPLCRSFEHDGDGNHDGDGAPIAEVLLELMEDDDHKVREWATCGIGRQLDVDGAEVRAALLRRLDDGDPGTRSEAIQGLARRRDGRALLPVLTALGSDDVPRWAVDASGYLADEGLLGALRRLPADWGDDPALLPDSIRRCDPSRRAHDVDQLAHLVARFEADGLAFGHGISVACPLFEKGAVISVWGSITEVLHYSLEELVEHRCGGDVDRTLQAIASDLLAAQGAPGT